MKKAVEDTGDNDPCWRPVARRHADFRDDGAADGHDMMCMSGAGDSMLSGMAPMYLLMAGFHLAPWLRLVAQRA